MLEIFQQLGLNMAEHMDTLSQLDLSSLPQELAERVSQISELQANGSWCTWCYETRK